MPLSTDSETYPTTAARNERKQRTSATSTDNNLCDVYNRCKTILEDLATRLDTLHADHQRAIDFYQPIIEALPVQAAHLSAEDRRSVGARQWELLLGLDEFKEYQDRLVGMKTVVEGILTKVQHLWKRQQSGEYITGAEKKELLAMLKVPVR